MLGLGRVLFVFRYSLIRKNYFLKGENECLKIYL